MPSSRLYSRRIAKDTCPTPRQTLFFARSASFPLPLISFLVLALSGGSVGFPLSSPCPSNRKDLLPHSSPPHSTRIESSAHISLPAVEVASSCLAKYPLTSPAINNPPFFLYLLPRRARQNARKVYPYAQNLDRRRRIARLNSAFRLAFRPPYSPPSRLFQIDGFL